MKNFKEILNERGNITKFIPDYEIKKEEIEEMIRMAGKSPSGWNLQHWQFKVFHTDKSKELLFPIAYYQKQIIDSSAVIAVLADTQANENFDTVYSELVNENIISEKIRDTLLYQVTRSYQYEENALEHAFTNAAMAAITLVYAAESMGYDSGIIGGFNKQGFVDSFCTDKRYKPIVLIPIGIKSESAHISRRIDSKDLTTWL